MGKMAGDEVAQVYLSRMETQLRVPIRLLVAFRRIHLLPGETKTIPFVISPDAFSVIDDKMQKVILPGAFSFSVGGGQPDTGMPSDTTVLKHRFSLL